ncbi:hypothetical protein ACFSJ3_08135 [Corallincola platygyrae]|uniref:Uncharacterized protein n=1 Tax=Corallincola platygyrae TaxID=1193278 RepID=A0ABW4XN96_9GAMM
MLQTLNDIKFNGPARSNEAEQTTTQPTSVETREAAEPLYLPIVKAVHLPENMHKKLISSFCILHVVLGCSTLPDEPWEDTYFASSDMDGHHNLSCPNEVAIELSREAIQMEFPEYYSDFLKKGFSLYSPIYGEYRGKKMWRYTYKSILGFKKISHQEYGGSHYERSLEVSVSEQCEVLGVDYFKGKLQYIY